MTMMANACPACSHWNQVGWEFCELCGNPLGSAGSSSVGPPRVITIGRDAGNIFVVNKSTVSSRHAQLEVTANGRLILRDLNSTNRTFVNTPVEPITVAEVRPSDLIFLGRMPVPVSEILSQQRPAVATPTRKPEAVAVQMKGPRTVFGRDPKCDYPLSHPMVSWRHAVLYHTADNRFFIEDLQSRNGTYVNGEKLQPGRRKELRVAADEISFGSYSFKLSGVGTIEAQETGREIRVIAKGVSVAVPSESGGTKLILKEASLTIEPGDLVALMGPSGAGKTTLMCALNGIVTPAAGQVLYQRGKSMPTDLRQYYEQIRPMIGYVPQDDIMHPQLTVFEALYYTAKLRLPRDFTDNQIEQRIATVLSSIGLWEEYDPSKPDRRLLQDTIIGDAVRRGVSGGQRKRVNLAMELLSEPALLFLDEPTSGLSGADARQVVQTLKKLADTGCTIVVTIHQPSMEVYQLFTLLAMVSNHARVPGGNKEVGKLVYFGPALGAFDFFTCQRGDGGTLAPESLEKELLAKPVDHWCDRFQSSGLAAHYGSLRSTPPKSQVIDLPPVKRDHLAQLKTLTERYIKLKKRDVTQMALALGLPTVFGLLVAASQRISAAVNKAIEAGPVDDIAYWTSAVQKVTTLQFLLVVAAFWFGCNNAIREVVGERAVYRRERMVNLSIFAYLGSKYVVLGLLALLQCAIMLTIAFVAADIKSDYFVLLTSLLVTALAGTGLGLVLSAALPTSEAAIASLPLVLLPMIVLGGGMTPLHNIKENSPFLRVVADVAIPTRWAFEADILEESKARDARGVSPGLAKKMGEDKEKAAKKQAEEAKQKMQDMQRCAQECRAAEIAMRSAARDPGTPADARLARARGIRPVGQVRSACNCGPERQSSGDSAQPAAAKISRDEYDDLATSSFPKGASRHSLGESFAVLGMFVAFFGFLAALTLKLGEVPAWQGFRAQAGHAWRQLGPAGQLVVGVFLLALTIAAFVVK